MKHIYLLSLLFLLLSINLNATITISLNGCSQLTASTTLSAPNNTFNCSVCGFPTTQQIAYKWTLSGPSSIVKYTLSSSVVFSGFSAGTYTVNVIITTHNWQSAVNTSGQQIGYVGWFGGSSETSSSFEAGQPVANFSVWDNSGTAGNDKFCVSHSKYIDASASFAERDWVCAIFGPGGEYHSTGWNTNSKAGLIDLESVWGSTMGVGTYNIQLAVSQTPCDGWEAKEYTIFVVSSLCRNVVSQNSLEVLPNPSSDFIRLRNLSPLNRNIEYLITSMNGQILNKGILSDISGEIKISHLSNGTYILRTITEHDGVMTNRFMKI